jgi:hypothetical protein
MENEDKKYYEQEQGRLIAELVVLHGERLNTLSERTAWNETCFKRVEDSGLIHMAEVIKKLFKDFGVLQVNHQKLLARVTQLEELLANQEQGGGNQSPSSTTPQTWTNKYGR